MTNILPALHHVTFKHLLLVNTFQLASDQAKVLVNRRQVYCKYYLFIFVVIFLINKLFLNEHTLLNKK